MQRIGNSTRVEESQIRSYKWASDKEDHEAFLYANIINFKRSSNPRGHAHHCVMCGDRKAAIPSQNKDVCKTCDSGYWLVESVQVVVKFCKGAYLSLSVSLSPSPLPKACTLTLSAPLLLLLSHTLAQAARTSPACTTSGTSPRQPSASSVGNAAGRTTSRRRGAGTWPHCHRPQRAVVASTWPTTT